MNRKLSVFLLVLVWSAISPAMAEESEMVDDAPSKEEIIKALLPSPGSPDGGLTRSMWVEPKGNEYSKPRFKSVRIEFVSGSDVVSETAISRLQPMGEALSSEQLSQLKFVIEGHTDSVGRSSDNDRLSLRRAKAVKDYLEAHFGIEPGRMVAVGKGERELLDTHNPRSPVNRRVKIITRQ